MHDQHDSLTNKLSDLPEKSDPELSDIVDFEFRLDEPVNTLPADHCSPTVCVDLVGVSGRCYKIVCVDRL
ncbi:hypothetical protein HanXRQr2_Chr14g0666861 [Helianthus annuus]|uniref:Uncharacterized protein n=1 Tax=Helianthus annuus TaxID=4232 RepID=A0A251SLN3_HELAN|nr:hypothetical protein HanXRQr2_Chr14g0666861 [Helianthus annuus]